MRLMRLAREKWFDAVGECKRCFSEFWEAIFMLPTASVSEKVRVMMKKTNELAVFQNDQFGSVRVIEQEGEPWFVAADVCRALEITNPSVALERLDDDEKMTLSSTEGHSGQRGGAQMLNIVNEPGMYALVLGSRKPEAKAFKRWITHAVIPSIRKHGEYKLQSHRRQMQHLSFCRRGVMRCRDAISPVIAML